MKIRWMLLFAMCGVLLPAHAQNLYHVEVIAFARDTADADREEAWSRKPDVRYPERVVVLQSGANPAFQLLATENLLLTKEATAIKNRRGMRVLTHLAWQQPGNELARSDSVLITGGRQFGNHFELEGSLTLGVENFLRADVNLWFSQFSHDPIGDIVNLPILPGTVRDSTPATYAPLQTVTLQEQRKMRYGELHYFDHPKFGLLVTVKPVPAQAAPTSVTP